MSDRRLDKNTAESEMEDSDFGEESENTTFAGEQGDSVNTDRDDASPKGRGGEGGMDMPPESDRD